MGRKPVDLTNQRFGKLVAIHILSRQSKNKYWLCKCDCGNEVEVTACNLKSGHALSCGCNRKTDIANQRFDNLVALEPTNERVTHDGSVV